MAPHVEEGKAVMTPEEAREIRDTKVGGDTSDFVYTPEEMGKAADLNEQAGETDNG